MTQLPMATSPEPTGRDAPRAAFERALTEYNLLIRNYVRLQDAHHVSVEETGMAGARIGAAKAELLRLYDAQREAPSEDAISLRAVEAFLKEFVQVGSKLNHDARLWMAREFGSPCADAASVAAPSADARNQRIVDLVCAPGSTIELSRINRGMVVVVDGRTGLDACEKTARECFDVLFAEADGGTSPGRAFIGLSLNGKIVLSTNSVPPSGEAPATLMDEFKPWLDAGTETLGRFTHGDSTNPASGEAP